MKPNQRPVKVIVVAYHAADALDDCLATLAAGETVTVVDNSSSRDVADAARRHGAVYVDPSRNLGFAAGVNVALRPLLSVADAADVLLLNPDARLEAHDAERLAAFLHEPTNGRVAAVSPRLVGDDGREQRVEWPFPSPVRAWAEAAGLGRLPAARSFVIGAVLLIRWEALSDIGLFDDRYFLYAEEADWQRRAVAKGWRSAVCNEVVAFHAGAGTSADSLERERRFHAAHEIYLRKWTGSSGWFAYRAAVLVGAAVRAAVLRGDRGAEAGRRAMIYLRGPLRSVGAAGD